MLARQRQVFTVWREFLCGRKFQITLTHSEPVYLHHFVYAYMTSPCDSETSVTIGYYIPIRTICPYRGKPGDFYKSPGL